MLIVNSIFITLVSLSYGQDGQNLPQFTKIVFQFLIPILGLVICYWWFKVTEKGFFWIDFWISQANALEASISSSVNPVKKGAEYSRINEPKLTRKSTRWIVGIISLIYIGILIGNLLEVNRVFLR